MPVEIAEFRPTLPHIKPPTHPGRPRHTPLPYLIEPKPRKRTGGLNKGQAHEPKLRDEVVRLYQRGGLSPKRIAESLGLTRGRVYGYIFRYRKLHGLGQRSFRE